MERPRWINKAATIGAAIGLVFLPHLVHERIWADQEPQVITRGNTERAEVALTFDCGPWVEETRINTILDVLDEYNIKSTFFVTGIFIEKHPEIFERIARTQEVANHTYSHQNHTQLEEEAQHFELRRAEELINGYGVSSKPFWRPPFGAWNEQVMVIANEEGYPLTIMWSTDSSDWQDIPSEEVKRKVLEGSENGAIIVMHCNSWQTAQEIQSILWHLREWQIGATTVSQVIAP